MRYFGILICILISWQFVFATHNRAGEITYKQIGTQTIEMTVTTYTKASSTAADRDSIEISWGDGTSEIVYRDNNRTRYESNDLKINYYVSTHTYPGIATYTISFLDPNRISGVLNINFPNSVDIPFFLSTTFTLLDFQFQGQNNSVILLQNPIDIGCVNKVFIHNPNAFDIDGDSIAYEFTTPLQGENLPVPDYKLPDEVGSGSDNRITINPSTGEIIWDSPKIQGEYNIAILVKEYRNGKLINAILRDMQILIRACENDPPKIESIDEICVLAGDTIEIPILITDPNIGQKVKFSVTGGPLSVENPIKVISPSNFSDVPFNASILWNTDCSHISPQSYQLVFRAVDNFFPDSSGLAFLKTVRITVVGPPPKNVQLTTQTDSNMLTWDYPYTCNQLTEPKHLGFSIWRRELTSSYVQDTCYPSLENSPYIKIKSLTNEFIADNYVYVDPDVDPNTYYCYRVQPEFAKISSSGIPFFKFSGLASEEICAEVKRNIPLLTKVSVDSTDKVTGQIHIRWTKPRHPDFDTLINTGPYTYELKEIAINGEKTLVSRTYPYFKSKIDSNYIADNLNTLENQFEYLISVKSQGKNHDSPKATSIFLRAVPGHKQINLSWNSVKPWKPLQFKILAVDGQNTTLLASTLDTFYTLTNLENGKSYCFIVEEQGAYQSTQIENPLINFSQKVCSTPYDNQAPCVTTIRLQSVCDQLEVNSDISELYNNVIWNSPSVICPDSSEDLAGFNIYFKPSGSDEFSLLSQVSSNSLSYQHPLTIYTTGCYTVTSFDNDGNESPISNTVCSEQCPIYILPNTFTPNGDGSNDVFIPRKNLFVVQVDFKVFNQWGNLLYETSDPNLNWTGVDINGKEVDTGTYYYTCAIYVDSEIEPEQYKILSGFIQIFK
ncbi:MAG: gliding motility-associated C-terminal domain-containing protein [Saprospiraceae bacterium]